MFQELEQNAELKKDRFLRSFFILFFTFYLKAGRKSLILLLAEKLKRLLKFLGQRTFKGHSLACFRVSQGQHFCVESLARE